MKLVLLTVVFVQSLLMYSQEAGSRVEIINRHTSYLGSESVNPFMLHQIQLGLNTKSYPILSFNLKSNSGNTMVHKTTLRNNETGQREIEFDAIIEKNALSFTYPLNKKIELFAELSFSSANGKGVLNPMSWIVRDNFIESVHDAMGQSDIYKRKEKGFNKFSYKSKNESGEVYQIESNKTFLIPVLLGANYYMSILQNEKRNISANTSLSFKIPLEAPVQQQTWETGLAFNINSTKILKKNKSFTASLHGSLYHHNLIGNSSHASEDKKISYKFSGLLGLNFKSRNSQNMFSLFATLNKTSSRVSSYKYRSQRKLLNQQAMDAFTEGNEYVEFGGSYIINLKNRNRMTIEMAFREDVYLSISELHKLLNGRNAEDFGVFLGIQYHIK